MTFADRRPRLLADVEAFCQELRPVEVLRHVEHRFNDQVLPLARKHHARHARAARIRRRGADATSYLLALARIGREGTGPLGLFFSGTSIGQYPILHWGNDEQKRRYLPADASRRQGAGVRSDRAGRRQQPAGDDHHLPPRRRPGFRLNEGQIFDLQWRHL